MPNAYISGTGFYVPEKIVANNDLSKLMDTSDEWIVERTGIRERRYVESNTGPSDLAVPAAQMALKDAGLTTDDIDLIVFATSSPDYFAPGCGCLIQERMGFRTIGAFDIRVQCAGFVYGLSMAEQYVKAGTYQNILLVGAEVQSTGLDLRTEGRDTAVIFADGAGAVIVSATDASRGILSTHLHSEGKYAKELWVESPSSKVQGRITPEHLEQGKHFLFMNGKEVFRNAVVRFPEVIEEALHAEGITASEVGLLIPHQANLRISQMVAKRLGLSENQVYSNIDRYGNTTAGSIPIALAEACRENRIQEGDIVVLAAFGSGFAWGSVIIRW